MWTKKSTLEIGAENEAQLRLNQKNKLRNALRIFFIILLGGLTFGFIRHLTGLSRTHHDKPMTFIEAFKKIPDDFNFFCVLSFIGFIYVYFFNNKFFEKTKSTTLMCDKCNDKINEHSENRRCSCGGNYLPMENFKWVED